LLRRSGYAKVKGEGAGGEVKPGEGARGEVKPGEGAGGEVKKREVIK
jgi:hypothetical protein